MEQGVLMYKDATPITSMVFIPKHQKPHKIAIAVQRVSRCGRVFGRKNPVLLSLRELVRLIDYTSTDP
jgi:hypothetical protein